MSDPSAGRTASAPPALSPDQLAQVIDGLIPVLERMVNAAVDRALTMNQVQFVPATVISVTGPNAEVQVADNPGVTTGATRWGGGPPAEGDITMMVYAGAGQVFALGVIPQA